MSAWWVRRDQWPNLELGPFTDKTEADQLADQLAAPPQSVRGRHLIADWTWSVVAGDWTGSKPA